jgi:hypothetical protein
MSSAFSGGVNPQSIATAAQNYVLIGKTVAGAVDTVEGLIKLYDSAGSITPDSAIAISNAFTGTMVGVAISAGAVSAGVGAAIVGAVAAVLGLLESNGLLGVVEGSDLLRWC